MATIPAVTAAPARPGAGDLLLRLPRWVRQRAEHRHPVGQAHISKQKRVALWTTIFAAVRTFLWIICMLVIIIHWLGVGGSFVHAFIATSSTVLFVTFISFYCNASTDAANLTAGMAALFSADSHTTSEATRTALAVDYTSVERDIARLAELQPGPDGAALAQEICHRLATSRP